MFHEPVPWSSLIICVRVLFALFAAALEKGSREDLKQFYMEYASTIFFVIFSSFSNIEIAIQEKG